MKILVLDIVIVFGLLLYYIISRAKILRRLGDYEIVDRQEGAALFEYTFSPKKIEVFGDFSMVLGKKFKTLVGEAVYDVYDYVHEDDASIRGRLHEFFDSDMEYFSSEVRILEEDGNYGWFRLTGTMFRDRSGKCERFIGRLLMLINRYLWKRILYKGQRMTCLQVFLIRKLWSLRFPLF